MRARISSGPGPSSGLLRGTAWRALQELFWRAAWAPSTVFVMHAIVVATPFRTRLDFTMHFMGGAAAAYFAFHALDCFAFLIGTLLLPGRVLFSFATACTVGVFWEFGEFLSDMLGRHVQLGVSDTMFDLLADAVGASAVLLLVTLADRSRPGARSRQQ